MLQFNKNNRAMAIGVILVLGIIMIFLLSRLGYERNEPRDIATEFSPSTRGYEWNLTINNPTLYGGETCRPPNVIDCSATPRSSCCISDADLNGLVYRVGIFAAGNYNDPVPTTVEGAPPSLIFRSLNYDPPSQDSDTWRNFDTDKVSGKGWLRVVLYPGRAANVERNGQALDIDVAPGMIFADVDGKLINPSDVEAGGATRDAPHGIVIFQQKIPSSTARLQVTTDMATFSVRPRG